jgi:hypothetical protein
MTRCRTAGLTRSGLLRARETVAIEQPTSCATSNTVGNRPGSKFAGNSLAARVFVTFPFPYPLAIAGHFLYESVQFSAPHDAASSSPF